MVHQLFQSMTTIWSKRGKLMDLVIARENDLIIVIVLFLQIIDVVL